jgi:outer membrane protein TolC
MRLAAPSLTVVFLAVARAAFAQVPASAPPPPVTAPPAAPPPLVLPAPLSPTPGAPMAGLPALPPPPEVSDPLLAPVPPPKRILSSWAEANDLLRARSTNLRVALDQVLQAEGQTIVALAQYLPSLGGCAGGSSAPGGCVNGSFTHQLLTNTVTQTVIGEPVSSSVPIPNVASMSATLSQNIINMQEYDQISINELAEDQSRMTVSDTRRTLALSLANQVVAVVTAERGAEINRSGLRVALEQLEITKRKEKLGAATALDVVRAKQNAANARATLVTGDESLREAREALGLALGIPEETGVAHDMTVDGLAEAALRPCRSVHTVEERPDIAAARKNLEVAKRNLRNTWYSFLPVLTGSSSINATTAANAGYPNPTWSIGAALSVPLFDGGTRKGLIKSGEAAEDIALQNLETLRRQAIIQVQQAQRGVEVAKVSYAVALDQRDLAAQNDEMTEASYMQGRGTSVDLVTASEAHRQAEQSLAVAEFGAVKARLAAVMALSTCPW